ncbi:hypothetical protein A374_13040 [Fictibacillus macauensis ZFHKF-1]|uniref:Uncharacterized protein n=1 Tax=Fictibacillus macauensis ZFHKF-1 TaxID=1196324 RepID=I8UDV8_9BACL|nr:hypothetical protein [Fictibacillus macauensis]EIT84973.1 hypothetical protein A374_13040 [Fictibacillus macauensis ZFHKF-1]
MSNIVMSVHASSKKQLERKMDELRGSHLAMNSGKEVILKVLSPDPDKVEFNDFSATLFSVCLTIKNYDDEK